MYDVNDDGSRHELWGRIIEGDSAGTGSAFQIASVANRSYWSPRVGWNPSRGHYFVVWSTRNTTTSQFIDISGIRVYSANSIDIDATILTAAGSPRAADLAYDAAADEWVIAYVYAFSATDDDVYAQRIGYGATTLAPGTPFGISTLTANEIAPAVAVDGERSILVAYQKETSPGSHNYDVIVAKANSSGVVQSTIAAGSTDDTQTEPAIAVGSASSPAYLLAWREQSVTGYAIRGKYWEPGLPHSDFEVADFAITDADHPAVAGGGVGFLIAYDRDELPPPDIQRQVYGQTFAAYGVYLPLTIRG